MCNLYRKEAEKSNKDCTFIQISRRLFFRSTQSQNFRALDIYTETKVLSLSYCSLPKM